MPHLLEVANLTTEFYTRAGIVKAVNGVNLFIDPGETLGIVGESGSGKSVTALSILRLLPTPPASITGNQILYQNQDILKLNEKQLRALRGGKISMIFQDPMTSLNPVYTVGFQIAESVRLHMNLGRKEAIDRAIDMLDKVGIPSAAKRINSYPHEFSGGMRQRVMIAIALSCNPELLIADEPTTALDVTIQAQILELMKGLTHEFHTAVMLITHDMGVVAGSTQRVVVMYAGSIVESATTTQLFAMPAHQYTKALLRSIPRLDDEDGKRLEPITGQPPDLLHLPKGCPFAARCPKAQQQCKESVPALTEVQPGQFAACFYPF